MLLRRLGTLIAPLASERETNSSKYPSRADHLSEPLVSGATYVPWFIGRVLLKMEEGRRARPRYDVPLRDAVTPHMGAPRCC
jgi:hypothetical protein